jgi:hypothetical protein
MQFSDFDVQDYRVPGKYSDFRDAAELANLDADQVQHLLACVPGEADGPKWYWIYLLKNGHFGFMWGGCDYSGWDCQAEAEAKELPTLDAIFEEMNSFFDSYDKAEVDERHIKEQLRNQIDGKQPYALDTAA